MTEHGSPRGRTQPDGSYAHGAGRPSPALDPVAPVTVQVCPGRRYGTEPPSERRTARLPADARRRRCRGRCSIPRRSGGPATPRWPDRRRTSPRPPVFPASVGTRRPHPRPRRWVRRRSPPSPSRLPASAEDLSSWTPVPARPRPRPSPRPPGARSDHRCGEGFRWGSSKARRRRPRRHRPPSRELWAGRRARRRPLRDRRLEPAGPVAGSPDHGAGQRWTAELERMARVGPWRFWARPRHAAPP